MADIFTKPNAVSLLKGKFILLLGDSNMRSIYKDLVYLIVHNNIIPFDMLTRHPLQCSFVGDEVLRIPSIRNQGRDYYEEREYKRADIHIRFVFITRVYGDEVKRTLNLIETKAIPFPDIVIVNSCMWDLTRWGAKREDYYKGELVDLFSRLRALLPDDTVIIWTSTLPSSVSYTKGGFLIKQLEYLKYSLRFMLLEANRFTQQLCIPFKLDFLDLHYHMRFQLHRRSVDGVHWEPQAVRFITLLLLTHISLALKVPLPGVVKNKYVRKCVANTCDVEENPFNELALEKCIAERVKSALDKLSTLKKPEREKGRVKVNADARKPIVEQKSLQTGSSNPNEKRVFKKANRKNQQRNGKEVLAKDDLRNLLCSSRNTSANTPRENTFNFSWGRGLPERTFESSFGGFTNSTYMGFNRPPDALYANQPIHDRFRYRQERAHLENQSFAANITQFLADNIFQFNMNTSNMNRGTRNHFYRSTS